MTSLDIQGHSKVDTALNYSGHGIRQLSFISIHVAAAFPSRIPSLAITPITTSYMDSSDQLPSYAEVYRLAFSPERLGKRIAAVYADDAFYRPRLQELSVPQPGLTPEMVRHSRREQYRAVLQSNIRLRNKAHISEPGALEALTRMPLDILYEVCTCSQHCVPLPLCLLARYMLLAACSCAGAA